MKSERDVIPSLFSAAWKTIFYTFKASWLMTLRGGFRCLWTKKGELFPRFFSTSLHEASYLWNVDIILYDPSAHTGWQAEETNGPVYAGNNPHKMCWQPSFLMWLDHLSLELYIQRCTWLWWCAERNNNTEVSLRRLRAVRECEKCWRLFLFILIHINPHWN